MTMFKTLMLLLLNVVFLSTNALGQEADIPSAERFLENHGLSKNQEVPDFQYESIDGDEINLKNYEGEFILIDFWGTWCQPCYKEALFLKEAHTEFGDQIKFIGVAVDDKEEKIREFNDTFGIQWTQIMTSSDSELINKFNVKLFPTTILIGPDQKIVNGANSEEQIGKLKGKNLIKTLETYVDS